MCRQPIWTLLLGPPTYKDMNQHEHSDLLCRGDICYFYSALKIVFVPHVKTCGFSHKFSHGSTNTFGANRMSGVDTYWPDSEDHVKYGQNKAFPPLINHSGNKEPEALHVCPSKRRLGAVSVSGLLAE